MSHLVFKQALPQDSVMQRKSLNQTYLLQPVGRSPQKVKEDEEEFIEVQSP
jgi:hypothetical protein